MAAPALFCSTGNCGELIYLMIQWFERRERSCVTTLCPSPPLLIWHLRYSGMSPHPRHSERRLGRFLQCPNNFTWEFPQKPVKCKRVQSLLCLLGLLLTTSVGSVLLDVVPHVCSRSVESGVPRSQAGAGARVGRPRRAVVSLSSPSRLGQSGDKETMACESKQQQGVSRAPGSPPCRALQILIRISSKGRRDFLD